MRHTLALVAAWLSLSGILTAQPAPKLDSASVTWLQRGSTQQVTLKGEALSGITAVLINSSGTYGSGMSATPVAPSTPAVTLEGSGNGLSSAPGNSGGTLTLRCVVSADAALGPRELRVAGPDGVSNPLTLQVSDLLEITDPKIGRAHV